MKRGDFIEYYSIRENSLSEKDKNLFREMSLKFDSPDFSDLSDNFFKSKYVQSYLNNSTFVDEINITSGVFKVYKWFSYLLFLSTDNHLSARIEFEVLLDRIKMTSIEVAKPYKGLMRAIYLEYLLPQYKIIESDNIQTVNAFIFYKKLAIESLTDNKFKMYIKSKEQGEVEIHDITVMDNSFGTEVSKIDFSYVIKQE